MKIEPNIEVFNNNSIQFESLYHLDIDFKKITSKTLKRYYISIGKTSILNFQLNYLNNFDKLIDKGNKGKVEAYFYKEFMENYFDEIDQKIFIENYSKLKKLLTVLKISEILMDESIKNNDLDCLIQSFFNLKEKINEMNLLNKRQVFFKFKNIYISNDKVIDTSFIQENIENNVAVEEGR